jgi:hypothetical protein
LGGPPLQPEAAATAVINQLAVVPEASAVVLVWDNYHLIGASAVHDSVAFLVERLPPGLRLVLASRADPPLAAFGVQHGSGDEGVALLAMGQAAASV